jgi:hypothetical protein
MDNKEIEMRLECVKQEFIYLALKPYLTFEELKRKDYLAYILMKWN